MFRRNLLRIFVGICFILAGAGLIFYPQIGREIAAIEERELIDAFERLGEYNFADNLEIDNLETDGNNPRENDENNDSDKLAILKNARGVITIPTIDAELMIFGDDTESSLSRGVGMIEPEKTIGINNVGLAGHRALAYGRLFNRLDEIEVDDKIYVKTTTDNYEFTVVDIFIVDRTEVDVLDDEKEPYLTLVTCTPLGAYRPTNRLIVQAKLTNR